MPGRVSIALVLALACLPAGAQPHPTPAPTVLEAADFGVLADGTADDGPAIARLLTAARGVAGAVVLHFPPGKTVYVKESPARYVFPMDQVNDWTLDGAGCTFLLDPHLRLLDLSGAARVRVCRLNLDFSPLPFADGLVVGCDADAGWIEARLDQEVAGGLSGGPTGEDGEQAFFSMLWNEGTYGPRNRHFTTTRLEPGTDPGTVRVYGMGEGIGDFVEPGATRISIPVPGIAHRHGPGPCVRIHDTDQVTMEDVEMWSAPWFGFQVSANRGEVAFRRVNIRPKPGSGRRMSLWRDGFHVKGNRGRLLWEDCVVDGMCDDAFNIATHARVVQSLATPTRAVLRQVYPLNPIPWQVGDAVSAVDPQTRRWRGTARVAAIETQPHSRPAREAAPLLTVELDRPIPGLSDGDMVWQPAWTNPDTTLRRCRIGVSCRMQSPVTIEDCDITALLWFSDMPVEGPIPSRLTVRNCRLRRGRGNETWAVIFSGEPRKPALPDATRPPRALRDVAFLNNQVSGGFRMTGVENVRLVGNRFLEDGAPIELRDVENLHADGNRRADGRVVTEIPASDAAN